MPAVVRFNEQWNKITLDKEKTKRKTIGTTFLSVLFCQEEEEHQHGRSTTINAFKNEDLQAMPQGCVHFLLQQKRLQVMREILTTATVPISVLKQTSDLTLNAVLPVPRNAFFFAEEN
jgi:hypothetical protein